MFRFDYTGSFVRVATNDVCQPNFVLYASKNLQILLASGGSTKGNVSMRSQTERS